MTRLSTLLALALALTACRKEEPVDLDGDSKSPPEDCNDLDGGVFPGAEELCDGIDNNCDGSVDEEAVDAPSFYADADGDGYGDAASAVSACAAPEGYVADDRDCDDSAANIHPGAAEADCSDSTDYNCDGSVGYADADADGHAACEDCDDSAPLRFPGNPEICDDLDNDCDDTVDEEATDADTFFADYDGDGYGNAEVTALACAVPEGFAAQSGDCDDLAASAFPGGSEVCDGLDNDCDGTADIGASDATAWYPDQDGDRFGDGASAVTACEAPEGHLAAAGDCDDADASAHPGGTEVCDGADDDCDGQTDEDAADRTLSYADADADGYGDPASGLLACEAAAGRVTVAQDCDDANSARFPGNAETCDRLDNDCDGAADDSPVDALTYYADGDADGFGAGAARRACALPAGGASANGDCDDTNADRFPGNTEVCDTLDNDCDGAVDDSPVDQVLYYADADRDGYGVGALLRSCEAPAASAERAGDCDDTNADRFPGNTEVCDTLDNDCDGAVDDSATDSRDWFADLDRDGYAGEVMRQRACEAPGAGWSLTPTDCDDLARAVSPDADERCNGVDDDCDEEIDEDSAVDAPEWLLDGDLDGYGLDADALPSCAALPGRTLAGGDCNDADAALHPGAAERCDSIDQDCDGDLGLAACEDCAAIKSATPAATDGVYTVDLDGAGAATPIEVFCEMSSDGGGWTQWWWHDPGDLMTGVTDMLGEDFWSCDVDDSSCYSTIPVSDPSEVLVLNSDGNWAIWRFDGSAISNKVFDAFVHQTPSSTANGAAWNPRLQQGSMSDRPYHCDETDNNGTDQCDSFSYSQYSGVWSFYMDDDTGWAETAFGAGYDNGNNFGVDSLETVRRGNSTAHGLYLFYR